MKGNGVMDEHALKAQGVTALGTRTNMLKTFELVRMKVNIDDLTALSPPTPSSGGGHLPDRHQLRRL